MPGESEQGAAVRMLSAVQHAHYVEGRRVVDDAVLADVAASTGLATDAFARGALPSHSIFAIVRKKCHLTTYPVMGQAQFMPWVVSRSSLVRR